MAMCFGDESFNARLFIYVAVQFSYGALERIEEQVVGLKNKHRIRGEVKWHDDKTLRMPMLQIVASSQPMIRCFVVRRRSNREEPERERKKCLQALFHDITQPGTRVRPIVVLDGREATLTRREVAFLDGLRSNMNLPPYLHAPSSELIGLQCADFVAGAVRVHEDGASSTAFEVISPCVRLRAELDAG